jgi:hypothetical protein
MMIGAMSVAMRGAIRAFTEWMWPANHTAVLSLNAASLRDCRGRIESTRPDDGAGKWSGVCEWLPWKY